MCLFRFSSHVDIDRDLRVKQTELRSYRVYHVSSRTRGEHTGQYFPLAARAFKRSTFHAGIDAGYSIFHILEKSIVNEGR